MSQKLDTRTCKLCGRMFQYLGFGACLCEQCKKIDDVYFKKVKDYLYDNPGATAIEISDNTGVSISKIQHYLREGRLEIPEGSPIFIHCERCHDEIRSGRICSDCAAKLSNSLREDIKYDEFEIGEKPKRKTEKTGKMHFITKEIE